MKKAMVVVLFIVFLSFEALSAFAGNICRQVNFKWLRTHVPIPNGQIISKREMGDLCEVILKLGPEYVPIYTGKDFVIAGEMYRKKVQVTQERIVQLKSAFIKGHMRVLKQVVAITYQPKDPSGVVFYMVSDPLCPFCERAGHQVKGIADEYGATVKMILWPVHGIKAENRIAEAVCGNFNLEKYVQDGWKKVPWDKNFHQCKKATALLAKTKAVISHLGLQGVPAFVLDNGTFIDGANMPALRKVLEKETIQKARTAGKDQDKKLAQE